MLLSRLLLIALTALILVGNKVEAVRFHLDGGSQRCFTLEAGYERRMLGEVRVTDGEGESTIKVVVMSPKRQVVYQKSAVDHGKFSWTTDPLPRVAYDDELEYPYEEEELPYEICITNYGVKGKGKRMIMLHIEENYVYQDNSKKKAKKEHVDRVQQGLIRMSDLLNGMISDLSLLQRRELKLVKLTEDTNRKLTLFAGLSFCIVIAASLYQLRYYKTYFRTKKLI